MYRKAFTLIELLVVIAIIALLVSILLPSLNKAKDLAKRAVCAASLRNAGTAVQLYTTDNDGFPPPQYGSYITSEYTTTSTYFNEQYAGDYHSFILLPYKARTITNVPWWNAMGQYLGGGENSSEKTENILACPAKSWDATSWLSNNSYHWWGWTCVNVTRRGWWAGRPRGQWNVAKITYADSKMQYADDLMMSDICTESSDGSKTATHAGTNNFSDGGNQLSAGGSVKWMNFGDMCESPAVPVFSHIYGDFPE